MAGSKGVLLGQQTANRIVRQTSFADGEYNASGVKQYADAGEPLAILFTTRTGGIAARTTTSVPHTFPSATVDLIDEVTGNYYSPNRTVTVYNMTNITITHIAGRPRQAKKSGSRYFIDTDDC